MQNRFGPIFNTESPQAGAIASLFGDVLVVCAVIFAIVTFLVAYNMLRYRGESDAAEPRQIHGHKGLEITWTAIPCAIVLAILLMTARVMSNVEPPDTAKPDLVITAHQFWWDARYVASGVHAANEIHLPVGQRWLVEVDSADVIHDFWTPQLARKMDAVPGHPNRIWLEADKPGTYLGACNEYCGEQHAWMRILVIAQTPADFAAWSRRQLQPASDTAAVAPGRQVFRQMLCINCHAVTGIQTNATAAPDLTHLAERETIGAGVLANSSTNLFLWLKNPQAIKPSCLMPNFNLTDVQARALTAFLEASP